MSERKDSSRTREISFLMEWFTQIRSGDSGTVPHCLELFPVTKFMDKLAVMTPGHTRFTGEVMLRDVPPKEQGSTP